MSYSAPSKTSKNIVVDANLAAGALIPIRGLEHARDLFDTWVDEHCLVHAPDWWLAEVLSVIRQHVFRKLLLAERGHQAVKDLFALEVQLAHVGIDLCFRALDWAEKISQPKAYDAIYLALAEDLDAEFWTADRKLAEAARAAGADWVKWAGEA